jgi:hypothetical protein
MFEPSKNPNLIIIEDLCMLLIPKNEKTSNIDVNWVFQDVWTLKLPWEDPICNEVGLVTIVKCCVCSKFEKKEKVLVVKWYSIKKDVIKRKAHNCKWFTDSRCSHGKNEIVYV